MIRKASLLTLLAFGSALAEHPLAPAEGAVSVQDLKNLAWSAGFGLEMLDYETAGPWCLSFTVALGEEFNPRTGEAPAGSVAGTEAGHICNRAGSWRLTVQWTREAPDIEFEIKAYDRESGVGSGIGGTTVRIDDVRGWSQYHVPDRVLRLGEATELVKLAATVSRDGQRVPLTVRATLQENPDGEMGSMGRVQAIAP